MKFVAEISDPIHHYIYLTEVEKAIIDTPIFQRLRYIKQLAGAYLTYPSAHHTRFEHSLGTMHLAGIAGDTLYRKGFIDKEKISMLRLAALLHDVGHGPFSHLFEEVIEKENVTHEELGFKIIKESIISDILNSYGYNPSEVGNLAIARSNIRFLNELISGILSIDSMDYLQRDSYFTGVEHAKVDSERIIKSYEVYNSRLAINKSAIYSLESLLISRYQMFKAVYFHKTVRAAEVMLIHAMLESSIDLKSIINNLDEYLKLTDEYMLNLLTKSTERSAKLVNDYIQRRLLKCVFEKVNYSRDRLDRYNDVNELKEELASKAGVSKDNIYIDICRAPSLSLTPTKDIPDSLIIKDKYNKYEIEGLKEFPLLGSISGYMNIFRVYTHSEFREQVTEALNKVLNKSKDY